MRPDLADAYAGLDWAIERLPNFRDEIYAWLSAHSEVVETEPAAPYPGSSVRATGSLPLRFNVEAGCLINAIRSALDLLATALARRSAITDLRLPHFPFATDAQELQKRGTRGWQFLSQLKPDYRTIIVGIGPYLGGDSVLCSLHALDNMRKHRQLLKVTMTPMGAVFAPNLNAHQRAIAKEGALRIMRMLIPDIPMTPLPGVKFVDASNEADCSVFATLRTFESRVRAVIGLFEDN